MIKVKFSTPPIKTVSVVAHNKMEFGVPYHPVYKGEIEKNHVLIQLYGGGNIFVAEGRLEVAAAYWTNGNYTFVPSDKEVSVTFSK